MSEESKINNISVERNGTDGVVTENQASTSVGPKVESEDEDEHEHERKGHVPSADAEASGSIEKKKKSKKKKIKAAVAGAFKRDGPSKDDTSKAVSGLNKSQIADLLAANPALARELGAADGNTPSKQTVEAFKNLSLQDIMTGLAAGGKNAKDMASYKFWQTQPVPKLDDKKDHIEEGPFKIIDLDKVPKEPSPLMEGFEWVTMDLTREEELKEVFELLDGHYVEDGEAMFRFNYSSSFLRWALLAPGWRKEWHVGVRASKSQKLVAFISAIPVALRVRQKVLRASEVNFLCIHKKLRSKRLAPVLIKEITRRSYLLGIWQAIYTAGVVLPTPVSTCRYFHRSLDWQKLYEVKFSPLPPNSKPQYQVRKFALPEHTATKGLRPMGPKDVDAVLELLKQYLARFDMAPVFTKEEVQHWLLHDKELPEQVIWSYVVEDPSSKKITDYFSFYSLESTVINSSKHGKIRAAYLFYYASEVALEMPNDKAALKTRLNAIVNDALILAKRFKFDVFNALSLMDNALFLEQQKFGKGDGQLHYYLYNYNANHIAGGVDKRNEVDEQTCSGIGVVML